MDKPMKRRLQLSQHLQRAHVPLPLRGKGESHRVVSELTRSAYGEFLLQLVGHCQKSLGPRQPICATIELGLALSRARKSVDRLTELNIVGEPSQQRFHGLDFHRMRTGPKTECFRRRCFDSRISTSFERGSSERGGCCAEDRTNYLDHVDCSCIQHAGVFEFRKKIGRVDRCQTQYKLLPKFRGNVLLILMRSAASIRTAAIG